MEENKFFYYRIYDDKEEFSFIKSSLTRKKLEELVKEFEKTHKKYINATFVKYIKKEDPDAEIIKVVDISY
ncbi:MAG: hypothetical protein Q8903_10015 [Bacteroidota bacterium]|nr:hypothetical protein [Bacteroidota bacterium]